MRFGRKTYYWMAGVLFILLCGGFLFKVWSVRRAYDAPRWLELVGIDGKEISLSVPLIKRQQAAAGTFCRFNVSDKSRKNYVLNWNRQENKIYFSICRGEFGGLIIMSGYYDVDSEDCVSALGKFLRQYFSPPSPAATDN